MKTIIQSAGPLLRVGDVGKTIDWYREVLGFSADPFPDRPPYVFAILNQAGTEIVVKNDPHFQQDPKRLGWDVYLRLHTGNIRGLYQNLSASQTIVRRLERMPYPMAEFEIQDPDGYRLCLREYIGNSDDLPRAEE